MHVPTRAPRLSSSLYQKAAARAERIAKLVENLDRKLSIFTESAAGPSDPQVTESFRTICKLEAEELKQESYGVDLLHAIGFVYAQKGKQYLASNQTFLGMGGWLHNVQGKYHVFSETYAWNFPHSCCVFLRRTLPGSPLFAQHLRSRRHSIR